ncbi:MAG: hypothetical protein ACOYED_08015 [Peptococcia bacterium]|jgi:hypothetical protein
MNVTRVDLYGRINGWFDNKDFSLLENIKYSIDIDIKETRPSEYYKMYLHPSFNKELYEKELQAIEKNFAEREKDLQEFCKQNPELKEQIKNLKVGFKQRAKDRYDFTDYCTQIMDDNRAQRDDIPEPPQEMIERFLKEEYNPYFAEGFIRFESMRAELETRWESRLAKLERRRRKQENLENNPRLQLPEKFKRDRSDQRSIDSILSEYGYGNKAKKETAEPEKTIDAGMSANKDGQITRNGNSSPREKSSEPERC